MDSVGRQSLAERQPVVRSRDIQDTIADREGIEIQSRADAYAQSFTSHAHFHRANPVARIGASKNRLCFRVELEELTHFPQSLSLLSKNGLEIKTRYAQWRTPKLLR